ncbi:MAG TPA: O-antigen polymerase [Acidobacteriaceae bacterium]
MYRYARSMLFPPAMIAAVWAITIATIWMTGDLYFPLTNRALEIVIVGIIAFSAGGVLAVSAPRSRGKKISDATPLRRRQIDRLLNWTVVLMVLDIPFFLMYLKSLSGSIAPRESMWKQVRIASNKANVTGGGVSHIESMILPFLSIAALIAVCEYADSGEKRWRTVLIVVLAAAYQMANGARSEVLLVLVSCVVVLWLRRGVPPTRMLLGVGVTFLIVFAVNQVAMRKYGAGPGASIGDNLPAVAEGFGTYWLGGIIAFDQNRQNPELRFGWSLGKFATRIVDKFGANLPERDRNLDYTKISPTQITNVYTIFLPFYMDHGGMLGVAWLMAFVGFVAVYVYRCAIHGTTWAVFMAGALVFATLMTIFSEEFFAQIMFWIKAGLVSMLVYHLPPLHLERPADIEIGLEPLPVGVISA